MNRRWMKKMHKCLFVPFFFYWNCVAEFHLFSKAKLNASARYFWPNKKFNFIKCRHTRKPSTFKWSLTRISCLAFAVHTLFREPHSKCDEYNNDHKKYVNGECASSCISLLLCRLSLLNCFCGVYILNWRHPSPSYLN